MKEKCKFSNYFSLLFAVLVSVLISCNNSGMGEMNEVIDTKRDTAKAIYYCPMHPEVVQNFPGKCPKPDCMGMDLMLKMNEEVLNAVLRPVNSSVMSKIKTVNPIEKVMSLDYSAYGTIEFDPLTYHNIAPRISGRIEKLYIKYNYQPVKEGQRLFDIYSPELVTAQENLVYLLNSENQENSIVGSAIQKLKLLGFSQEQLDELTKTKKIQNLIPVYSKWNGHVHEMISSQGENENSNSAMGNNMGNNTKNTSPVLSSFKNNSFQTPLLNLREGMYVTRGQIMFKLVDPHNVVATLQIRPQHISRLKLKQVVELTLDSDSTNKIFGKIEFIEPFLKTDSKTLAVRVNIKNTQHKIKVGTFVKAKIRSESAEGLFVPYQSVVDLGKEKIVWVKENGSFIAKKIEIGIITKDLIEIYDGITKKDEIALEAHYLNDSESFIKVLNDNNFE